MIHVPENVSHTISTHARGGDFFLVPRYSCVVIQRFHTRFRTRSFFCEYHTYVLSLRSSAVHYHILAVQYHILAVQDHILVGAISIHLHRNLRPRRRRRNTRQHAQPCPSSWGTSRELLGTCWEPASNLPVAELFACPPTPDRQPDIALTVPPDPPVKPSASIVILRHLSLSRACLSPTKKNRSCCRLSPSCACLSPNKKKVML